MMSNGEHRPAMGVLQSHYDIMHPTDGLVYIFFHSSLLPFFLFRRTCLLSWTKDRQGFAVDERSRPLTVSADILCSSRAVHAT